ncbi:glycosyltransferase family 2 protein [Ulvibacterium sp.]|uniref:glycosyltransferase family 2 protein n=1 Tax=Ulvibacterium sp. TaxID=2665914 RepID=UPI00261C667F|nr:glycosyltransferase family 2 protein [Ulvibacterium sp.]
MNYYIIIPAHNEEAFLADTLNSVQRQTLLPKKVVVVNDNSTDGTESIIDHFVKDNPHFEKLNGESSTDHLPGRKVINAFNKGLGTLDEGYDFLVKLDADLILPYNYFEKVAEIFRMHPEVGIAGGFAYEKGRDGEWKLNHPMNKDHVRGAFKAYTRVCFRAIGGLRNAMGWDTVDELLAQYHGFRIFTDETLKVKHLRPTGKAYNKKARLLQGEAMYTMGYGLLLSGLASLKMALKQRNLNVFFHNLSGFFKARKNKVPFLISKEEARFIRNLRWKNIGDKLLHK